MGRKRLGKKYRLTATTAELLPMSGRRIHRAKGPRTRERTQLVPPPEDDKVAPAKEGSPTWLAVLAVSSLGVIVLVAGLSFGSLSEETQQAGEPESPEAPDLVTPPSVEATGPKKHVGDWTTALYGSECRAPCSAGPLCATTEDNTFKSDFCFNDKALCDGCSSKMTCVPGEANVELARGELWNLHLSTLRLDRKDESLRATQPRPCDYERDYWVCLRPGRGESAWTCLAVEDACRHDNKSDAFLPVSTEDLVGSGLEVEVRYSREEGPLLLPKSRQRFERGMKRRGLCSGFTKKIGETNTHEVSMHFFLEPSDLP